MKAVYTNNYGERIASPYYVLFTDHIGHKWVVVHSFRLATPMVIAASDVEFIK